MGQKRKEKNREEKKEIGQRYGRISSPRTWDGSASAARCCLQLHELVIPWLPHASF